MSDVLSAPHAIEYTYTRSTGPIVGAFLTGLRDRKILGTVTLADQLRVEARQAVNDLKAQGYRVILLTGDSSDTARVIGRELGVEYIDTVLMHVVTEPDWNARYQPVKDVLEEAS